MPSKQALETLLLCWSSGNEQQATYAGDLRNMAKEPENPFFPSSVPADLDLVSLDAYEDEVAWLNDVLTGSSFEEATDQTDTLLSLAELDSKLSRLLAQLDSACAETSSQVDKAIDDISRSVPRLSFDLQLMREHALLLRFTLDGIRKRSSALPSDGSQPASNGVLGPMDPNTYQVMERLRVLDMVKGRMEASRDVLREAESWSTLDSEVTSLISEQAYGKAADRLAEAAKSMVVFQNTPEYEARRALMISLQNSLEASLSTSLVSAISSRDVKACKSYYSLFGQIQREAEFRNYYYGSRRAPLVNAWSSTNLSDCIPTSTPTMASPSTSAQAFSAFLPSFYDDLRLVLEEERSYVSAIFPNPLPTLSSFLSSTLDALAPSLSQRLTECADVHGPSTLNELIKLYHATEDFALRVDSIMSRLIDSSASTSPVNTPSVNTPTSAREKRMSKRMSRRLSAHSPSLSGIGSLGDISESDVSGVAMDMATSWEVALFEPFLDWQVEYLALESRFLSATMHGEGVLPGLLESGASGQQMRVFWDEIQHVFAACEEAMVRNAAFTHGYGWVQCVQAVDDCLSAHLKQQTDHLDRLSRKQKSLVGDSRGTSAKEVDLDGLDYSTEDWNLFQLGLKLLSISRQLATRLTAFEDKLKSRMSISMQAIKASRPVVPGTTNGAISLLRQSTLFSTELSALLDQANDASQQQPLCHVASGASTELAKSCQNLVHQTILRPLIASLSSYAALPAWSASADSRPEAKSAFDLNMPTFSLSPTEIISRLGEGLFNLPSLFEVYADDDALSVSLETLPFVDLASYQAMQAASIPSVHARRQSSYGSNPDAEPLSASITNKNKPEPLSAEAVISAWLSSLTLTVLAHLTGTALPAIRSLTSHGSAQLASDLAHISNVAKALDVESEDLERWKEVSEMSDAEGRRCVHDASGEGDRILLRIGKMRRWC